MDTLSVWSRNGFAVSGSSHAGFDQQWKKVLWFGWCTGPIGGLGEGNTYQSWTMCPTCRRTCSTRITNYGPFKSRWTSFPYSTYSTSWWSSSKSENPLLWWPAYQSATGLSKKSKSKQPYSTGQAGSPLSIQDSRLAYQDTCLYFIRAQLPRGSMLLSKDVL